jgi:hypothetical protein
VFIRVDSRLVSDRGKALEIKMKNLKTAENVSWILLNAIERDFYLDPDMKNIFRHTIRRVSMEPTTNRRETTRTGTKNDAICRSTLPVRWESGVDYLHSVIYTSCL